MVRNQAAKKQLIELKNVHFNYGDNAVLEDVSFSVAAGDYIGVIGPNGGGKTTLLSIMLGLIKPSSGQVLVFGKKISELKRERAHIGYVPQRLSQLDANFPATVYEIVASGRTAGNGPFHIFSKSDKEAVERAMAIAKVGELRRKLIGDLSGGERQRVMIARSLAGEPKVLILDEPTTGVDIASQEQFYHFLGELNHEHGLTIIFVSHDIDIVANEVHSLLLLNRKVVSYGPAKDMINKHYLDDLYGGKIDFTFHPHHHH
jgi:zinc transport system ATP-binding protein